MWSRLHAKKKHSHWKMQKNSTLRSGENLWLNHVGALGSGEGVFTINIIYQWSFSCLHWSFSRLQDYWPCQPDRLPSPSLSWPCASSYSLYGTCPVCSALWRYKLTTALYWSKVVKETILWLWVSNLILIEQTMKGNEHLHMYIDNFTF